MVAVNMTEAADHCSDLLSYVLEVSGGVFPYDLRIFDYNWDPIEAPVNDYFDAMKNAANITALWEAIHVNGSTKIPIFEMGSEEVANALASDSLIDYSSYFNSLFARNSKVLIYAGEFDT